MSLGVVAQRGNDAAVDLARRLRDALPDDTVRIDAETGAALGITGQPVDELDACDLIVSIGGDGTFLFVARHIGSTPLLGVNLGEVGFLTAVSPDEAIDVVQSVHGAACDGTLDVRTLPRIHARGSGWRLDPAVNEVMVHAPQRGPRQGIDVDIRIDGHRYDRGRVDGLMVASPTGSTAYNLSERGPLVASGVEGLIINQMCARDGRPPLVVRMDATVTVEIAGAPFVYVVGDGRDTQRIELPAAVTIERAAAPLRVAGPPVDFYQALDKLL